MKTIAFLSVGALVIAAVFGVVAYRTVQAKAPAAPASALPLGSFAHPGPGWGFGGGIDKEGLADALGITVDELVAAYEEASNAALDQAVADGLITQAQADQLRENGAAFPFGGRWSGWLSPKGWLGQNGVDFQVLLADALGISVEDLQNAYLEAINARIDQAVTNGNLTEEQADLLKGQVALFSSESFRSAMQSAFESAVQAGVDAGLITQAQADKILEHNAGVGFPGLRGFGGFGRPGRHGGWGGFPVTP